MYIIDGCNGQVYLFGEQLVVLCQTEESGTSARTNCEDMGGKLLELETEEKLDNFIEVFNGYSLRYIGNMYNIYIYIYSIYIYNMLHVPMYRILTESFFNIFRQEHSSCIQEQGSRPFC